MAAACSSSLSPAILACGIMLPLCSDLHRRHKTWRLKDAVARIARGSGCQVTDDPTHGGHLEQGLTAVATEGSRGGGHGGL
jgi:hypothetical protein